MSTARDQPHAKRRFGQNFLIDTSVIAEIIDCVAARPEDNLIEIGPGSGALTSPLLRGGAQLTAVEIDHDLIASLTTKLGHYPGFKLVQGDALTYDFRPAEPAERKLRIVGNLPYNISSPLLLHLLSYAEFIEDMHLMLQREVALRLAAAPRCADYGRLTIACQSVCTADLLFDVDPGSFQPAPSIVSSLVRLTPKPNVPSASLRDALGRVTQVAFSQRRKMIRHTLGKDFSSEELSGLAIESTLRPEEISVANYLKLAEIWVARRGR